ncbi:hypothetical protein Dsin_001225 [Dipteronia sinensis]|uniref:Putative plant transposon protein domain-containing protein n=1 Tax=Dipteronia sinensis TaxID=43782 RepID=A0AAE0EII7_9ROSI|nr:hypothetical protein Dsin_001225 [Dipteronia sinensis]
MTIARRPPPPAEDPANARRRKGKEPMERSSQVENVMHHSETMPQDFGARVLCCHVLAALSRMRVHGYQPNGIYQLYNQSLANFLQDTEFTIWNTTNMFVQGQFDFKSAFWHTFFNYSLFPSYHRPNVTLGPFILLYLMKKNLPFDCGTISLKWIAEAGRTNMPSLALPCLITHFCDRTGVRFLEEDEWISRGNVGIKAYSKAAIPRGILRLDTDEGKKKRLQKETRAEKRIAVEAGEDEQAEEEGFNLGAEPSTQPERRTQRRRAEQIPN